MIIDEDIYLEHHGVKGMHWGVRNDKGEIRTSVKIMGSLAAAAAIGAGAYFASQHMNTSTSDLENISPNAGRFAEAMAKEPVGIVHVTRGDRLGYCFPQRGGLEDPHKEFEKAGARADGGITDSVGTRDKSFKRYGDNDEKIIVDFLDPEGRKDFSGRPIHHTAILPKDLSINVTNEDEAATVAWSLLKDTYQAFWDSSH